MTLEDLRDQFAAAALTGMLSGRSMPLESYPPENAAISAYRYADAMLVQRRAYCPACGQKLDPTRGFIVHESGCSFGFQDNLPTMGEI